MVNYKSDALDRTFSALADPTRRALLARLEEQDGVSVSDLARPFPVSLPAIMKHLDVLADAGLVVRSKAGRTVTCRLKAEPMEQAMNWLAKYERYWTEQLDRLAAFVERDDARNDTGNDTRNDTWQPSPASPSSAVSRRRRKGSSKPGPSRRK